MSKKWLIGVLVFSVLLNIALIGVFVGQRLAHGFGGPPGGPHPFGIFRWTRTLDEERRSELEDNLAEYRNSVRGNFRAVRQAQRSFREAMLQEPMDRQKVQDALDALQKAMHTQQTAGHTDLVGILEQLSIEERRQLDSYLQKPRRGRPRADRAGQ